MGWSIPTAPLTVFASAARTATATSSELRIPGGPGGQYRGLAVIVDVTAITATPSVTFAIQSSSGPDDDYVAVLTSAAIVGTGSTILVVHPSVPTERTNVLDQGPLESKWRVVATHGDADSITYSVTGFGLR